MRTLLDRLWSARGAIVLYLALILGGWAFGVFLHDVTIPEMRPMNEPTIHNMVMIALIVFVICAAIPFVPGAEIGFALLLMFGGQAAPMVYVAMVAALLIAYLAARILPSAWVAGAFAALGLRRASALIRDLASGTEEDRLSRLTHAAPKGLGARLLKNRYLLLAATLNMPGNSLVGGGGGLAFAAGLSGVFSFWPYLAVVLVAVSPIPLLFWLA